MALRRWGGCLRSRVRPHCAAFTVQFVREFTHLGLHRSVGGALVLALARYLSLVITPGYHAFLFDTLALVRKLESQGIPTYQAEVLNESLESISESFVSRVEMQNVTPTKRERDVAHKGAGRREEEGGWTEQPILM